MSERELPEEWGEAVVTDIAGFVRGVTFKKAEAIAYPEVGYVPIIRANNIQDSKLILDDLVYAPEGKVSDSQRIKAGDVVVAMSSGSRKVVGKTASANKDWEGAFGAFCGVFRPSRHMSSSYFGYYFGTQEYRSKASSLAAGANINNLKASHFDQMLVPIPGLKEQKAIADKLDKLLAQVNNLKARLDAIPAILKRFRQSVLAAAVSGSLTDGWRGAPELTGWEEVCLGDVIEKPRYGTSSKSQKHGDVPVLRMGNLQQGEIDWGDLVYTSDPSEIEKYTLTKGDVLFNRTNSPELVGKTSIYRGGREAVYAGYLIRLRPKSGLVPDYLNYHLNSPRARRYCKLVKSDGVSQSNINAKKVAAYPMLLPPVEEQTEIVRRVDQLFAFADQIEQQVANAQARVDKLTQSILAKAFRGELTAEWRAENPELIGGEHSAEALLERIKAEKAKQTPTKTRRGGRKATVTS